MERRTGAEGSPQTLIARDDHYNSYTELRELDGSIEDEHIVFTPGNERHGMREFEMDFSADSPRFLVSETSDVELRYVKGWGSWGDHQYYGIVLAKSVVTDDSWKFGFSDGRFSGTNPTAGTATWKGGAIGFVAFTDNVARGTSEVTYDFDAAEVDIEIALDGMEPITWEGLGVTHGLFRGNVRDSVFSTEFGRDSKLIYGSFYGPGHEEAGGVFSTNDVVGEGTVWKGAFGAKREE